MQILKGIECLQEGQRNLEAMVEERLGKMEAMLGNPYMDVE